MASARRPLGSAPATAPSGTSALAHEPCSSLRRSGGVGDAAHAADALPSRCSTGSAGDVQPIATPAHIAARFAAARSHPGLDRQMTLVQATVDSNAPYPKSPSAETFQSKNRGSVAVVVEAGFGASKVARAQQRSALTDGHFTKKQLTTRAFKNKNNKPCAPM
ncbi:Protein of unknown function [Gryllus bimaculatus]|nr:Protein of unknown function [Gryllus bimaculatus]